MMAWRADVENRFRDLYCRFTNKQNAKHVSHWYLLNCFFVFFFQARLVLVQQLMTKQDSNKHQQTNKKKQWHIVLPSSITDNRHDVYNFVMKKQRSRYKRQRATNFSPISQSCYISFRVVMIWRLQGAWSIRILQFGSIRFESLCSQPTARCEWARTNDRCSEFVHICGTEAVPKAYLFIANRKRMKKWVKRTLCTLRELVQ